MDGQQLIEGVENIQALESVENGGMSKDMVLQYIIMPFLNSAGFRVFDLKEVAVRYDFSGDKVDVAILREGEVDIVYDVVGKGQTHKKPKEKFNRKVSLYIVTDGLNYVCHGSQGDRLVKIYDYSLANFDEETADIVARLLDSEESFEQKEKFYYELSILDNLGRLAKTNYLKDLMVDKLKNPPEELIMIIASWIHEKYCVDLSVERIEESLTAELGGENEVLIDMLFTDEEKEGKPVAGKRLYRDKDDTNKSVYGNVEDKPVEREEVDQGNESVYDDTERVYDDNEKLDNSGEEEDLMHGQEDEDEEEDDFDYTKPIGNGEDDETKSLDDLLKD